MDSFIDRLIVRAATIDELLSDDFIALSGQQGDADNAARRLAEWCRSSASGDWLQFARRLARDGLSLDQVLARFATVRRAPSAPIPGWAEDAAWIDRAFQGPRSAVEANGTPFAASSCAFEELLAPVVEEAEARLWASVGRQARNNLLLSAESCLRQMLLESLSGLCAPALYELFSKARTEAAAGGDASRAEEKSGVYASFVGEMRSGGLRKLFDEKPILLRLIAIVTRQWIRSSHELVTRLHADLPAIRRALLDATGSGVIARISGGVSDLHHGGRSVLIVELEDGARFLYKPKDLRLDALWRALVEQLNGAGAPVALRAARALPRDGYGWNEYIEHTGCASNADCARFFERAGAWLALFHVFTATDMHQENLIAAGDHPVPIDLETLLQTVDVVQQAGEDALADEAAKAIVANSVMAVGMLPAYGQSLDSEIYVVGGIASDWTSGTRLAWKEINTDDMRPAMMKEPGEATANLPHIDGRYARIGDHVEDFVTGFENYARFLLRYIQVAGGDDAVIFEGFPGLPMRKVVRPTQFYYFLLQRLRSHKQMDDGVRWSARADFLTRLADWDKDRDENWPLQRAERLALLEMNVPHFVMPSDGQTLHDDGGDIMRLEVSPGLDRARARVRDLTDQEIAWQVAVIRRNLSTVSGATDGQHVEPAPAPLQRPKVPVPPSQDTFAVEADRIADEIAGRAIRRGSGAAWIGLGFVRDSEVSQLEVLGSDLYNGTCGIALVLAAHAKVRRNSSSAVLARAAVAHLCGQLKSRSAPRTARSLGIGGATGLGSIVYALTVMSDLLDDGSLRDGAHAAAELFSDDLIAADKQLDIIGGSAGAILSLLRLHRDTGSDHVLRRAIKCGEHLLAQPRVGTQGRRSWRGTAPHMPVLNGMSHGAAGFAYALAALATAAERQDFADAATECIAYENSSFDVANSNWPDFREAEPHSRSQWCHGAVGLGLARLAMARRGNPRRAAFDDDIGRALEGASRGWPGHVDTLCCGTLGSVELLREAGKSLGREELSVLASQRLGSVLESAAVAGDYRWNGGERRFNLGLFRGVAGIGYACLRQVDGSLPNILIWE